MHVKLCVKKLHDTSDDSCDKLTKRLHDGQVGLSNTHWCSHDTNFLKYVTTPPGQHAIDSTDGGSRTLFQVENRHITKLWSLFLLSVHLNTFANANLTNHLHLACSYLDLHKVDWLQQSGFSCELTCIQGSAGCGNNLATTTVNGICMQGHIMDVKANTSHILFTEDTLKT